MDYLARRRFGGFKCPASDAQRFSVLASALSHLPAGRDTWRTWRSSAGAPKGWPEQPTT